MDYGHWQFPHEFEPTDWFGFIYRITELDTGREYIGKKQFSTYKRKIVKNKKNRKKVVSDSKWRSYTGSSNELNEQISIKGINNYKFEIQSLHKTRGSLYYAEVKYQIIEDVLREKLPDGITKKYYNKVISGVKFIPPVEHEDEIPMKVVNLISNNNFNLLENIKSLSEEELIKHIDAWISYYHSGSFNRMYGKESPRKGKSFEEIFGKERAASIKQKLSSTPHLTGENHPMYGKKRPDDFRQKMSKINKGRAIGDKNPMYGKPCYYKMSEDEKEQWRKNVGDSIRGIKRSEETRKRMSESGKGKKMTTVTCPHCQQVGGRGNMLRYHFDNCKKKLT